MTDQTDAECISLRLSQLRGSWKPENYSAKLLIPDDRIMIASDVHLPYYDERLTAKMFSQCRRDDIQAIVFTGDLIDIPPHSQWSAAEYARQFPHELSMLSGFLEIALSLVDVVYWSVGAHEVRWMKQLDNLTYLDQLARLAGLGSCIDESRLILSDNPSLEAFGGEWLITHPAQCSDVPLDIPMQLAARHRKNVISGCSRHWGMGAYEKYTLIETGGLFQPEYARNIQYGINALRTWFQGFWTLIDGAPMGYRA